MKRKKIVPVPMRLDFPRGGRKQWIQTGLDLSEATLEDKQAYLREQWKYDQAHMARN